jgi:hypothetical protein
MVADFRDVWQPASLSEIHDVEMASGISRKPELNLHFPLFSALFPSHHNLLAVMFWML